MRILVVAATEMEIAETRSTIDTVDYLVTGVGVPNCIFQLQKKLFQNNYDLVIQAGIAGTFSDQFPLGKTVLVKKDQFADLGFYENQQMKTLFDAGFHKANQLPYKEGWLENNNPMIPGLPLPSAAAITVNTVTDDRNMIRAYKNKYEAGIESMEGAALHFVCIMENIDFLQIRSLSNWVGDRDKSNWKIKAAVTDLNFQLSSLLNSINK
jgi:futalosine hydrolase